MENTEKTTKPERELMVKKESVARCRYMGKRLGLMFWLTIANIIMVIAAIAVLALIYQDAIDSNTDIQLQPINTWMLTVSALSLVIGLVNAITVITMKKVHDGFMGAGVLLICMAVLSFIQGMCETRFGSNLCEIISAVCAIPYIFGFTKTMSSCLEHTDAQLAEEWDKFRGSIKWLLIVLGACFILIFVPLINILALIAVYGCAVAAFFMSIWHIILLKKSASSMKIVGDRLEMELAEAGV